MNIMGGTISKKEKEELFTTICSFLLNAEPEYKYDLGDKIAYLFNDPTRHAQYLVLIQVSKEKVFNGLWPRTVVVEIEAATNRYDLYDILEKLGQAEKEAMKNET